MGFAIANRSIGNIAAQMVRRAPSAIRIGQNPDPQQATRISVEDETQFGTPWPDADNPVPTAFVTDRRNLANVVAAQLSADHTPRNPVVMGRADMADTIVRVAPPVVLSSFLAVSVMGKDCDMAIGAADA